MLADLSEASPALIDTVTTSVQTTADVLAVSPTVLAAGVGAVGVLMHAHHASMHCASTYACAHWRMPTHINLRILTNLAHLC